jgi:hypothetical protein
VAEIDLALGIVRFKGNEDRFDRFLNGTAVQTVITSGGQPFPTVRKFLADKNTEINVASGNILSQSVAARDAAQDFKNQARISAEKAAQSAEEAALFDPSSYFTKIQTQTLLDEKADEGDVYSKDETDARTYTKDEVDDLIALAGALPIGTIIDVYGNGTSSIPGFLKVIPGLEVTNAYPGLRAFGLANGWSVNGAGNPTMPEVEAPFKRQWAPGQTRDAGRVFGSVQMDALQQILGSFYVAAAASGNIPDGPFTQAPSGVGATGGSGGQWITFDASRVARTAAETRPTNITVTYYIKAYAADQVPGSVEFAGFVNDLASLLARATTLEQRAYIKKQAPLTPSGNAFDVTGIPAGIKRLSINFAPLTLSAGAMPLIRLGSSAGILTTGYVAGTGLQSTGVATTGSTTGAILGSQAHTTWNGRAVFERFAEGSNQWVMSAIMVPSTGAAMAYAGAMVALPGELDRVQMTTTAGTPTLSGSVSLAWEF